MNILVVNGSPRSNGNTAEMVDSFTKGAREAGNEVIDKGVYASSVQVYQEAFIDYMKTQDMGIITAHGEENKSEAKLAEAYKLGKSLG
ncbi:MAG TPA: flavodoxin family protein [Candidatus Pelethocola excrementipullorum]|nr:flavodoxin family protein [Candidatus Pelethocola excrementipullorum]